MKQWAILTMAALVWAGYSMINAEEPTPKTWDENATAESLGLTPIQIPSDFFPLFPWGSVGDTDPLIESMADCAFNMSGFIPEAALPVAKKYALKSIPHLPIPFYSPEMDEAEYNAKVKEAVASTKDDPNVLGYYLIDEPGADKFASLAVMVRAIQKNAPGKLAYINLFPGYATTIGSDAVSQLGTHSFTEYLERYVQEVRPQFISYDNYMVEYSEDMMDPGRAASYWTDMIEVRRVAMKYRLPWWNIISCLCIQGESSPPSPARFAFQAYTSLAAGCNGLSWFIYTPHSWTYSPLDAQGRKTLTWSYLRTINEQILTVGTFMNQYESTDVWFSESVPTPNLPTNPKNLIKDVNLSWSKMAGEGKITETPQIMVGQFKSKDGSHDAVMIVNLNFGRSVKVELETVRDYKTVGVLDSFAGTINNEKPANGWWVLPGHGSLFILQP